MFIRARSSRRTLKPLVFLLIPILVSPSAIWARKKKEPPPPLTQQIEQILNASMISKGFLGIEVYSIERNKVVYEKNSHQLFVPASNTKIFVTTTALARLPADFRFHTTLESTGRTDKYGRLNGDLIFVGRGDPNLSNRPLPFDPKASPSEPPLMAVEALVSQLVARGIRVIDGDVIGDDSFYVNEPYGDNWGWDDLTWSWGAPVSALTLNDNVFSVTILPGELVGDHPFIAMEPFYPSLKIQNGLHTTASGTERHIHIERGPGGSALHFWGTVPLDAKPDQELLAVEEPARVAAGALRDALQAKGIRVYGDVRVHHREVWEVGLKSGASFLEKPNRTVLAEIVSHPLREDLKVIAKVSQNLHAEMLLRLLGAQLKEEGSVRAGLQVEKEFLKEAGVEENEYLLNDGSGMDSQNLVAPHAMVQLLKYVRSQPYRDAFIELLPVAGVDGTIASRFKGTPLAEKVFAKTGTLTHVNALSGYATSPEAEHFVFSMFVNNHSQESKVATTTLDKILETIVTYREPTPRKSGKK